MGAHIILHGTATEREFRSRRRFESPTSGASRSRHPLRGQGPTQRQTRRCLRSAALRRLLFSFIEQMQR